MTELSRRMLLTNAGTAISVVAIAGCTNAASSPHAAISPGAVSTGPVSTAPASTAPATSTNPSPTATTATTTAGGSLELKVGALADVPLGGAKLITVDGHDMVLTQAIAGQPSVFVNRCPHQGCKVDVSGALLVCPCHASKFDLNGKVVHGPAESPLTAGSLRVDNGQIIVEQI